jgi:hypothetical protein
LMCTRSGPGAKLQPPAGQEQRCVM